MNKHSHISIAAVSIAGIVITAAVLITVRRTIAAKNADDTTYTVRMETYENVIEIAGNVSAADEQSLQALSDGTVVAVSVKEGAKVKKGDLILQMDDTTELYNLAKEDYDIETTKVSGSQKQIALMQKQRTALAQKVRDRKVVATFDGIIASLDVAVGDSLEAKDEIGTLVDRTYLLAKVEIAETDVKKLKIGQKVQFTFPAYPGKTIEGYVVSWPAIGTTTTRGATVVKAKLRIDNPPEEILPNYSFTGKIEISPSQKYTIVERYAVGYDAGKAFVQKKGTAEKLPVTVEPYGTEYVRILSGVQTGDVLKAQSKSSVSGQKWRQMPGGNNKNKNQNTMTGMPGGGMGGPPPGGM